MKLKELLPLTASFLVVSQALTSPLPVFAKEASATKKWTVTDRQEELRERIDQGQKSYELTVIEMKRKPKRTSTRLSLDIDKHKLAKRTKQR